MSFVSLFTYALSSSSQVNVRALAPFLRPLLLEPLRIHIGSVTLAMPWASPLGDGDRLRVSAVEIEFRRMAPPTAGQPPAATSDDAKVHAATAVNQPASQPGRPGRSDQRTHTQPLSSNASAPAGMAPVGMTPFLQGVESASASIGRLALICWVRACLHCALLTRPHAHAHVIPFSPATLLTLPQP